VKRYEPKDIRAIIFSIVERLKNDYTPDKIILYGSFAYGEPDKDSDIDFLIIKDTHQRPIDRRVVVRRIISDLRRGVPFSSIVITPQELKQRLEIGDQFFEEIISKGEVLYAR